MNTLREHDPVIGAWFDDGPRTLPADTRQAITVGIRTVTRRRSRIAWPLVGRGLPTFKPRRLPVALASAAVVVVAAAAGLNVYVSQLGTGTPALPTTPDAWSRSRLESPRPPHLHAWTAGGPGLVVVGAYDGTDEQADIWTSSNGRTWSRVPGDELGPGVINDVTSGGPGLVAVGYGGGLYGAVWTSRDGLTWSRAPHAPVFEREYLRAVSEGGPGLVAVGGSRAWFSSDGLIWEAASAPPALPGVALGDDGVNPQVFLTDVAAAGDRLVAVGWMTMDDESTEAVMWASADGMTWTNVPLDPEVFPRGSEIAGLTGGPDGFVAIVDGGSGPNTMLHSPDGLRWSRIGSESAAFRSIQLDPDGGVNAVTAGSGGYVAVGADGTDAAIWTSPDGQSWARVPTGPVFQPSDPSDPDRGASASRVFPWGTVFVATGMYDGDRAIWISDSPAE